MSDEVLRCEKVDYPSPTMACLTSPCPNCVKAARRIMRQWDEEDSQ